VKLTVISPEGDDPRELFVLEQLLAEGLADYHVRKPGWSRDAMAAYLGRVPAKYHPRLVLHSHHDLAAVFAVGGLHERDHPDTLPSAASPRQCQLSVDMTDRLRAGPFHSRAVHDLAALRLTTGQLDRVLFSPVFPSISKPGRTPDPRADAAGLRAVLALPRRAEVFALGGVDVSRLPACRGLGFDGVAVLGAVWQSADPLGSFRELQQALFAHAA
jgi:thiamine-phosphate pyrophosphorylase